MNRKRKKKIKNHQKAVKKRKKIKSDIVVETNLQKF